MGLAAVGMSVFTWLTRLLAFRDSLVLTSLMV
jgi:hypothetical protein